MYFLAIERFADGNPRPVKQRFQAQGRMMPEGVVYVGSWIDAPRATCYQIMESTSLHLIEEWADSWRDIVEITIIEVMSSPEYWLTIEDVDLEEPERA